MQPRLIGVAGVVGLAAVMAGTAMAHADEVKFNPIGAEQTFTVPDGVTSVRVITVGGKGGVGQGFINSNGGFGAVATADLNVTPGQILFIEVGGNGATGSNAQGGFNGGGAPPRQALVVAAAGRPTFASLRKRLPAPWKRGS